MSGREQREAMHDGRVLFATDGANALGDVSVRTLSRLCVRTRPALLRGARALSSLKFWSVRVVALP